MYIFGESKRSFSHIQSECCRWVHSVLDRPMVYTIWCWVSAIPNDYYHCYKSNPLLISKWYLNPFKGETAWWHLISIISWKRKKHSRVTPNLNMAKEVPSVISCSLYILRKVSEHRVQYSSYSLKLLVYVYLSKNFPSTEYFVDLIIIFAIQSTWIQKLNVWVGNNIFYRTLFVI